MTREVFCIFYEENLPGLAFQLYPGEIGEKIFNNISQKAWNLWLTKQTMLVNEHKLSLINAEHQKFLEEKMLAFLFEKQEITISGFKPVE